MLEDLRGWTGEASRVYGKKPGATNGSGGLDRAGMVLWLYSISEGPTLCERESGGLIKEDLNRQIQIQKGGHARMNKTWVCEKNDPID